MRSSNEHRWTKEEDLVVFYLAHHGSQYLDFSLEEISKILNIEMNKINMRMSNSRSCKTSRGLNHPSKQTQNIYEENRCVPEPDLRIRIREILNIRSTTPQLLPSQMNNAFK